MTIMKQLGLSFSRKVNRFMKKITYFDQKNIGTIEVHGLVLFGTSTLSKS